MATDKRNLFEIERLVLGALLLNEQAFWDLDGKLEPHHFTNAFNGETFRLIAKFCTEMRAVTLDSIAYYLRDFDSKTRPQTLLALMIQSVSENDGSVPVVDYAEILADNWIRNKVSEVTKQISGKVLKADTNTRAEIEAAIDTLQMLMGAETSKHVMMLGDAMRGVVDRAGSPKAREAGITPPIPEIADLTGQWMPGDLILMGGFTGGGKTALAAQLSYEISKSHRVDIYELEMTNDRLATRLLSMLTKQSGRKILEGRVNEHELDELIRAADEAGASMLRLIDEGEMSVAQIKARAMARKKTGGLDLIVVDHAKLLAPKKERWGNKLHESVYENAKLLKVVAKELQVPVLLLCQFLKGDVQEIVKRGVRPRKSDFYGGQIEEHADHMLALVNRHSILMEAAEGMDGERKAKTEIEAGKSKGRMQLFKLKDRFGPASGDAWLRWDAKHTKFGSLDDALGQEEITL